MVFLDSVADFAAVSMAFPSSESGSHDANKAGAFCCPPNSSGEPGEYSIESVLEGSAATPEKQNMYHEAHHRRKVDSETR